VLWRQQDICTWLSRGGASTGGCGALAIGSPLLVWKVVVVRSRCRRRFLLALRARVLGTDTERSTCCFSSIV
jgi:hypothetical protein